MIAQTREDKISRLERLMDGILPTEEFMEEEFIALVNEHKVLQILVSVFDILSFLQLPSFFIKISY